MTFLHSSGLDLEAHSRGFSYLGERRWEKVREGKRSKRAQLLNLSIGLILKATHSQNQ